MASRVWWTLERFGLTPRKILWRFKKEDGPRVACISIPKAGTHLLERAVCLHPKFYRRLMRTVTAGDLQERGGLEHILARMRAWQVLVTHLRYDEQIREMFNRFDIRTVFIHRDPRDIVVSQAYYVIRNRRHPHHKLFTDMPTIRDRVKLVIRGDYKHGLEPIGSKLGSFAGWRSSEALALRFEDLVGPRGNETTERQKVAVRALYQHVGAGPTNALVETVAQNVFSEVSPTFRAGGVGQWWSVFDDEMKAVFKEEAGHTVVQFGYEEDYRW